MIPERFFAPYVEAGLLQNAECVISDARGSENRFASYAARRVEWRFNAYILPKKTAILSGWREGFERMKGSLLGYEGQNAVYIKRAFNGRERGNSLVPSTQFSPFGWPEPAKAHAFGFLKTGLKF